MSLFFCFKRRVKREEGIILKYYVWIKRGDYIHHPPLPNGKLGIPPPRRDCPMTVRVKTVAISLSNKLNARHQSARMPLE